LEGAGRHVIVRYRAQALADIDAIYLYLQERSPRGAQNVLQAIYAGVQVIAEQPYSSPQTDVPGIRVKVVRRYRFKIFYSIVNAGAVEILHVRHTARRPWP
jgi:plasmid stabilization system protein ParE